MGIPEPRLLAEQAANVCECGARVETAHNAYRRCWGCRIGGTKRHLPIVSFRGGRVKEMSVFARSDVSCER